MVLLPVVCADYKHATFCVVTFLVFYIQLAIQQAFHLTKAWDRHHIGALLDQAKRHKYIPPDLSIFHILSEKSDEQLLTVYCLNLHMYCTVQSVTSSQHNNLRCHTCCCRNTLQLTAITSCAWYLTLSSPVVSSGYTSEYSRPYWSIPPILIFLTFGHSGAQD